MLIRHAHGHTSVVQNFAGVDKYVEALLEARKGKNMTHDAAMDAVTGDVNMFGVMMVAMGDAGGMVSGSIHTTAATIRPAMQVLKTPNLVSSIFFMCLPDKVRILPFCGLLTCRMPASQLQRFMLVGPRQRQCPVVGQPLSHVWGGGEHARSCGCILLDNLCLSLCRCLCMVTALSMSTPPARTWHPLLPAAPTQPQPLALSHAWQCCPTPLWDQAQDLM